MSTRHTFAIHDEFVHAPGSQSGADSFHYHLTGVDVAYYLRNPLRGICTFFQQDNSGLLQCKGQGIRLTIPVMQQEYVN